MKNCLFKSYPGGSSLGGGMPAHASPYLKVDADWVLANGGRAQRRRMERELKRTLAMLPKPRGERGSDV